MGKLKQIERSLKAPVQRMLVPTGAQVCQKQLLALMHKVKEVKVNEAEIGEFLPAVLEELNDLSKPELIKRFASIEFNRFLDYYRNAPDLNSEGGRGDAGRLRGGARFFINLGKMDGLDKSKMLEVIDQFAGLEQKDIGQIELKGAYSFFEVEKDKVDKVIGGFKGVEYMGRPVRVEVTDSRSGSGGGDRGDSPRPRKRDFSPKKFEGKKYDRFSKKKRY